MKYIILIVYFFSILILPQSGSIRGKITDVETGKPLVGANLTIQNTQSGSATINEGKYIITKLNPGNYDIAVFYAGYRTVIIKDVEVVSKEPTELNISLPRNLNFQIPADLETFYLDKIPSELKKNLEEIKKINKAEYFRSLQDIYFEFILGKDSQSNLESDILEMELESRLFALNYLKASATEKNKIRQELVTKIGIQFDLKQKLRLQDLNNLSNKIKVLEKSINDSKSNKEWYVNEKVQQLLGI